MKLAIIGATGYGGVELLRLLHNHPQVTVHSLHATSLHGEDYTKLYPHMKNIVSGTITEAKIETLAKEVDLVFLATPSEVSLKLTPSLIERGIKVIDLSGDYRLKQPQLYEDWYGFSTEASPLRDEAIYGLSEWLDDSVEGARLIANPGCFPTAILLGLAPLIKHQLLEPNSIIIDAKTGVSGAGKGLSAANHFSDTNENIKPYRINDHQHTPEIEQELKRWQPDIGPVTFTPHLLPMTRGILASIYGQAKKQIGEKELIELYESAYEKDFFVRIKPAGTYPHTKEVFGSNYCDIGLAYDERTGRITIISAIDNLIKGASGQAIQNMNKMLGFKEETGLELMPVYP